MRIFKRGHAVVVLLLITFGLFVGATLGFRPAAAEPAGDLTVAIFTDLPSQPDAPLTGPGWLVAALAILWGLFEFAAAALAGLTALALSRCRALTDLPALPN